MPGYVQPSAAQIRARCHLLPDIELLSSGDLDTALVGSPAGTGVHITDAETKTELEVGSPIWSSAALSAAQARALAASVAYRTGAEYLRGVASERVTGTNDPLMMEQAEQIRAQADALEAEAVQFDELVKGEVIESPAAAAQRVTGRARLALSTVDPYSIAVRPSERIEGADERDDLPAGVLVR